MKGNFLVKILTNQITGITDEQRLCNIKIFWITQRIYLFQITGKVSLTYIVRLNHFHSLKYRKIEYGFEFELAEINKLNI